jgi:formylglycine-generating enzyme required for sulfatase activity
MAPKIFLAHAREDKPQVRKLYADLTARGLDPWLDEVDLVPGQIWKEEIPRAIRQAGIFLACLSSGSAGKVGYVQNEFRLALSAFGERPPGSIYLIPVRLDDCDVPDLQIPDRGLSLQDIQWVDLWEEGGFDRLVKAIERALEGLVDPRQPRGAAIPLAEPRAKDVREELAPEATQEQAVIAEKEKRGAEVKPAPDAFLSYTRFDDRHDGGAISELCRRLASAVQAVTGGPFDVFQDVEGIGIGEHWPGKLDQMLDQARFFIPILTPSYFTSRPCRDELEKFLRVETKRGRNDLVLPIYYIECDVLEDDELCADDSMARTLHERQHQDWRELRFEPFDKSDVRRSLERLARDIVKARKRVVPAPPTPPVAGTQPHTTSPATPQPTGAPFKPIEDALGVATDQRASRKEASTGDLSPELVAKRRAEQETREQAKPVEAKLSAGGEPKAPTVFRDINDEPWCPELVVISPGTFMMGYEESGQHEVRIDHRFAVGRYPVTFEEYDFFHTKKGRGLPNDQDWGRGRRPVIDVSWEDAKAYVAWLTKKTDQPYRLLSEAEWEYAARAGTATRYWWGDDPPTPEQANFGNNVGKTREVGSYPANPWGLHDMNGNVWEWVEDCWHESYEGAPSDGSAWLEKDGGDCSRRVLRGGSWDLRPEGLRSAGRFWYDTGGRFDFVGFRVARTLR